MTVPDRHSSIPSRGPGARTGSDSSRRELPVAEPKPPKTFIDRKTGASISVREVIDGWSTWWEGAFGVKPIAEWIPRFTRQLNSLAAATYSPTAAKWAMWQWSLDYASAIHEKRRPPPIETLPEYGQRFLLMTQASTHATLGEAQGVIDKAAQAESDIVWVRRDISW